MQVYLLCLVLTTMTPIRGQLEASQRQFHLDLTRQKIIKFLRPFTALPEEELVHELRRLPSSPLLKLPLPPSEDENTQKTVIIYGTVGRLVNADNAERFISESVVSFNMPSQEFQWDDASVWLPTQQPSPWIGIRTESSETGRFERVRTVHRQGWLTARIAPFLFASRKGDVVEVALDNATFEEPLFAGYVPPFLHLVGEEVHDSDDPEDRWKRDLSAVQMPIDCEDSASNVSCCRDKIRVSFEQLGWAEKVLEPKHFDLYFCRGSCDTFGPWESFDALDYSVPMRAFQKVLNLQPCCVAKRSSPLQLTLATENSAVFIRRFVPDLIIEECACLGTQYLQKIS